MWRWAAVVCHKTIKTETPARKWGWKAAEPGTGGYSGDFPSELPPDASPQHHPPTTGCPGQPLPLRTSCLVLAGRSPGLEEPHHCDQSPSFSLPFLFILSFLICLPVSLSPLLLFFFFHYLSPPPHFGLLFIYLFAFKHFWLVRFVPFTSVPESTAFTFPFVLNSLACCLCIHHIRSPGQTF